jgi:hypothetical protein
MVETIEKRFAAIVDGVPDEIVVVIVNSFVNSKSGPCRIDSVVSMNLTSNGLPIERKRNRLYACGVIVNVSPDDLAVINSLID